VLIWQVWKIQRLEDPPAARGNGIALSFPFLPNARSTIDENYQVTMAVRLSSCDEPVLVDVLFSLSPLFLTRHAGELTGGSSVAIVTVANAREALPSSPALYLVQPGTGLAEVIRNRDSLEGRFHSRVRTLELIDGFGDFSQSVSPPEGSEEVDAGSNLFRNEGLAVRAYVDVTAKPPRLWSDLLFTFRADWLTPRGHRSCYLHLPDLVDPAPTDLDLGTFIAPRPYFSAAEMAWVAAISLYDVDIGNDFVEQSHTARQASVFVTGPEPEDPVAGTLLAADTASEPTDVRARRWDCESAPGGSRKGARGTCEAVLAYNEPGSQADAQFRLSLLSLFAGLALAAAGGAAWALIATREHPRRPRPWRVRLTATPRTWTTGVRNWVFRSRRS
jgi:hypothetical protein